MNETYVTGTLRAIIADDLRRGFDDHRIVFDLGVE